MPELCGSTTVSATKVDSAASAALPPARKISAPAAAARGSAALTIPGTWAGCEAEGVAQPATQSRLPSRTSKRMACELLIPHRLGNAGITLALQPLREA